MALQRGNSNRRGEESSMRLWTGSARYALCVRAALLQLQLQQLLLLLLLPLLLLLLLHYCGGSSLTLCTLTGI